MLLDGNGDPLPFDFMTVRAADGHVLVPAGESEGAFVFRDVSRKIQLEFGVKGPKSQVIDVLLIDAPKVRLTVRIDPLTGTVKELTQKPVPIIPKVLQFPGGRTSLMAPPTNDSCGTPQPIVDGATPFTTVDATTDGTPPGCTGTANIHKDIWFDYIATGTGTLTVSTCGAATFDTKIAIYNGLTCPAAAPIGCNDDFTGCAGFTSKATATVTAGFHYLIRVGGFSATTPTGTGTLTITPPAPPPTFDQCATPQSVTCGSSTVFNNSACTTSVSDPNFACRSGGPGQGFGTSWFSFVATGTNVTADTNGSLTSDTLLAVYSGTCGSLTQIGCDDDSGTGLLSLVTVGGLTIGQTYLIEVAGFGAGNVGTNTLNVLCSGVPQGDLCTDPLIGACDSAVTVNLATMSTSPSDPAFSCRIGGPAQGFGTTWITFVATDTSARIDTNASTGTSDTLLAVYSGTCGALVELCCSDDDGTGLLSELCCEGLVPGNTYYIQVAAFSATRGLATVTIECPCPEPPPNDACVDAIALGLPPVSVTVDTRLATDDIGVPCNLANGPFANVWYTVSGTGSTLTATTCNPGTTHPDTKISVFCGDCLVPVCVNGNDDDSSCGVDPFYSTVSWCSQPGVDYLVTVGGYSAGQTGVIELSVTDDGVPCTPVVQCLPVGACCLLDGSCVEVTAGDCSLQGGIYQGDGTACFSNAVQDPSFEAAVLVSSVYDSPDWTEVSTNFGSPLCDTSLCGMGGGTGPRTGNIWSWFGGFLGGFEESSLSQVLTIPTTASTLDFYLEIPVASGNGVDFLEVLIDGNQIHFVPESDGPFVAYALVSIPLGGFADGGVHTVELHSIQDGTGGTFSNFFVDDVAIGSSAVSCPQPLGACCLTDGTCIEVTEEDCAALGGTFQGDFTLCAQVSCPQPPGACCLVDGSCVQVTEEECAALGGVFGGDFSLCIDSDCPQPPGACCLPDGTCVEVTEEDCGALGGTFSGDFTLCQNVSCPQPPGACCLSDGACVSVTEEDCAALGGVFHGDFSLCENANCPQPIECFTLDFETDDQGNSMVHGTKVDTEYDGGPNYPVTITGSANPSGANTAAILNSTTGPAIQDPDLLVGSGNILILQNDANQSQCGPGVYCTHNDDEDGGLLRFVFSVPTTPSSIVLVDIDSTDPVSRVILTDTNGRTRTYTIPANWTGDLVTNGPPGKRTLDLTTLAPQAGFGSNATATQNPGFNPEGVVRIDVQLGGSGAVDDLVWCQDG